MRQDVLAGLKDDLTRQRTFMETRSPVYARLLEELIALLTPTDSGTGERPPDARQSTAPPDPAPTDSADKRRTPPPEDSAERAARPAPGSADRPAERLRNAWRHREFGAWYERPLLLLASLRDDALKSGREHPLWPAIGAVTAELGEQPPQGRSKSAVAVPPALPRAEHTERPGRDEKAGRDEQPEPGEKAEPGEQAVTGSAVAAACGAERSQLWWNLKHRFVQTNEPSRAVTWLWPAAMWAAVEADRPLTIVDVGASAGLNLVADRLPPIWSDEQGNKLAVAPLPPIEERWGFDLRPLDVRNESDARWLRACVWPGQEEREERLDRAIDAYRSLASRDHGPAVEAATAAAVPARLPRPAGVGRVLAYQTVVRDYLPADERAEYEGEMQRWLEESPPGAALWVELELAREKPSAAAGPAAAAESAPPAEITAHLTDTDGAIRSLTLARCEPHPLVIHVDHEACEALQAALRR